MIKASERHFAAAGFSAAKLRYLFSVALFLAVFAGYPLINMAQDDWREPVEITPANAGSFNVQNGEYWLSVEQEGTHTGYLHMQYINSGGNVIITETRFQKVSRTQNNVEITGIYERNALRPLKETINQTYKDPKGSFILYKEIYYDWKNKKVTIIPGQGKNVHNRVIPIRRTGRDDIDPEKAVSWRTIDLFMFDAKNLVPGREYQFVVFDYSKEKFYKASALVLREQSKGIYEVQRSITSEIGDIRESHYFVGPKSDKYPNGVLYSREEIASNGKFTGRIVMKKTSKAEATAIEKKKGEK